MSLFGITQLILTAPEIQALVESLRESQLHAHRPLGLPRPARAPVVAALHHALKRPIVYVTSSVEMARSAADALRLLVENDTCVLRFAEPNTAFYDTVAPVADITAQRSAALAHLAAPAHENSGAALIVSSPRALMHPTLPAWRFKAGLRVIQQDQTLALEAMLAHWVNIGYEHQSVVEQIGAFSRRGGIIDIWPPALPWPARIELFGNQIDSIRLFDPGTQRSHERIRRLVITPLESAPIAPLSAPQLSAPQSTACLIDYLGENGLLIIDDEEALREAWRELEERAQRERELIVDPTQITTPGYLSWGDFVSRRRCSELILGHSAEVQATLSATLPAAVFTPTPHFAGQLTPLLEYIQTQRRMGAEHSARAPAILVVSRQAKRLAEVWSERYGPIAAVDRLVELPHGSPIFVTAALPAGFCFGLGTPADDKHSQAQPFMLITDAELFGHVRPEPWIAPRKSRLAPERAFSDWQPGDAVVHEDYGIGIYRGLVTLTVNTGTPQAPAEGEREYVLIEYAEGDRLYVPLHQLDRIARYVGSDDAKPALSKLGAPEWGQAKHRARAAAAEVAREMLELYARRELAAGRAFSPDTPWQAELEASFPYVETEDQLRAIQEVKADMESSRPMDRLICGDVGYGKTEVALRAAFKAVQDGTQVAVLVPTTVLAQQHWATFTRRLAAYPVVIEVLSRFRSPTEKRAILDKLADGSVDIVIGTHALLSHRVRFKQLGLLIIDEEQRFGVRAKEKLKQLRAGVDVITLTATPIPRTLYLSLSGIRSISRIETPPAERLPIISYIGPFDDLIVQQAIRRELDRDGQVFFVHNRINSIHLIEQKLRRLIPDATLAIAHGQMDEKRLARVMSDFADGKIDILLCTNIVENGLDIPNANTIIVDRADHFGLAELYQLRGRVGRSTTQAYGYFLYDRKARMTPEARERLNTLREIAGLGAGYLIAMRDLELRGAGDILGPKQSGHVSSIGLDLYTRLLSREINVLRALRDGTPPPAPEPHAITIDLPLTVGLPESYVSDPALRVQLYRRVASLDTEEKVQQFEDELRDRFGKLPQPVLNLTYQARLKLHATALGAHSITTEGNRFVIRAGTIEKLDRTEVEQLLGEGAIIGRRQLSFLRSGPLEVWKGRLMEVITRLAKLASSQPAVGAPMI
ncbi:MAG: transcription-repair coupling factor [Anaerolineae bacterium]|nr:transcription-repair coupling factor [Thermoflexales bacterium]MDW8408336.1 transcription-repair coupling factor [Anaerolineae bacterium]